MTWNLVLQSFRLLRNHKKLKVFPILSAVGAAALAIPFLVALFGFRAAGGLHLGVTERLAGHPDRIIPGHDPIVSDIYPRASDKVDAFALHLAPSRSFVK